MVLIFIHGLGDDHSVWSSTLDSDLLSEHETHVLTLPGFGGRRWNGEGLNEAAELFTQYIDRLKQPVVVVGHSVGGIVGTMVAEQSVNVVGFVNVEGNLTEADCFFSARAADASDIYSWLSNFSRRFEGRYQSTLNRSNPHALQRLARDTVAACANDAIKDRYLALTIPTVYVHGDDITEPTRRVLDGLSEARTHFPGTGHWLMQDEPERFARFVSEWVTSTITD